MSSLLLVVTGASKGLGQAIATRFCMHESVAELSGMRALLVARSQDGLLRTKQVMQEAAEARSLSLNVTSHAMDLSDLDALDDNIDQLLEQAGSCTYDRVVLINNAGSLGHLGPLKELSSLKDFQKSIDFNVTSSLWLSVRFAKAMSCSSCVLVNISSVCAVEAFPTMGVYCTGKAARDMFYKAWAKELGEFSTMKLLNYAPGALETDMTAALRNADGLDEGLKSFFRNSHESGELIHPDDTAQRMIKLVWDNEFESGAHIDYWDLTND